MSLSRGALDALLPDGALWTPRPGGDLDKLLDGIAANGDALLDTLRGLSVLRDPLLTERLADLETEYGIIPDGSLAEDLRRARLAAVKSAVNSDGSAEFLQTVLRAAGFDVYVHVNDPPVDPDLFVTYASLTECGADDAECGAEGAQFGAVQRLLVNEVIYYQQIPVVYATPPSTHWPGVFFVGGAATRNGSGELTAIEPANVPTSRWNELDALIVKYKPLATWCGLVINYT